ncbi:MAG: SRPBCC family protein [Actinomycetota bacterium]
MSIEHTIDIDAPVERVWELTLDVESWPEHTPTMTSVERLDDRPLAVGSTVRIKQPAQRARLWTVSHLEPNRRFAWSAKTMGTTMIATHELTPNGSGTTQTLRVEIEGKLSRFVQALVGRPIAKAIATENHGFKTVAEQHDDRPATGR